MFELAFLQEDFLFRSFIALLICFYIKTLDMLYQYIPIEKL